MAGVSEQVERLRSKVTVNSVTDCWEWQGYVETNGYGRVNHRGRYARAHRVMYELLVGPIPEGLVLDHLCRVRHCVNPDHLEPVTNAENIRRGVGIAAANAAKTHCQRGHAYSQANTHWFAGRRYCRACNALRLRRRRAVAKAAS